MEPEDSVASGQRPSAVGRERLALSSNRTSQGQCLSHGGDAGASSAVREARAALLQQRGQRPCASGPATTAKIGETPDGRAVGLTESEKRLAALTEELRLGMNLASRSASAARRGTGQDDDDRALAECNAALSRDAAGQHLSAVAAVNGHATAEYRAAAEYHARPRTEPVGDCPVCHKLIRNKTEACTAMGQNYHARCFTCFTCGRSLKGKPFYWLQDKAYCEEDYKYTGFQQMAEHCRACGQLILDVVLQAVGQTYHPGCFRCLVCSKCLDGESFTLDSAGCPLCVTDYHRLYAPVCASCKGVIQPLQGTDETVRVVALGQDYHIDCYHCGDCGVQLTDEPEQRCYPLDDALLCRRCHVARRQLLSEPRDTGTTAAELSRGAPPPLSQPPAQAALR